jgi:YbbR domain-containing protein
LNNIFQKNSYWRLIRDTPWFERFKATLTQNLKVKIVVFLFAVLVWFFVITEDQYSYELTVPIRISNLKSGKIIKNDYPKSARIVVMAPGKHLLRLLLENDIEVLLNLKNINSCYRIKLRKDQISIPRKNFPIEPIRVITPDSIEIFLENIIKKRVSVLPRVEVVPVAGYTLVGEVAVTPESVWVSGPESTLKSLQLLTTQKLQLKNLKHNYSQEIVLELQYLSQVEVERRTVLLSLDIQKLMEKTISQVSLTVQNLPPGTHAIVIPPTLTLTLEGGEKIFTRLTEQEIQAYIDYARPVRGHEMGHPAIILTPPGVIYRDVKPQTFKLVLEQERNVGTGY